LFTMSQPALTSFFGQSKRSTRRTTKVLDAPPADPPPTKRSTRINKTKKDVEISAEATTPVIVKPTETVKVDEEANILKEIKPNELNKKKEAENNEPEKSEAEAEPQPKRGRKKVLKETDKPKDDCPSPAKRGRRTKKVSEVEAAQEVAKKLTPAEVKEKLKGSKLNDLKDRLKKIEESKESVKVKKAKAEIAAKKVEEDKAKKDAKLEYEKTPAYIRFHNLALKGDGTLPLPYSYKFLEEVFRCSEQITAMLHNRKEAITFEKLKIAVQQMLRKTFTVGYLKQIKTVFPEAYRFAWENVIGRYGKKLSEFELNISVNMKYKEEMISRLGGLTKAPEEDQVSNQEKLGPHSMVERKALFRNCLGDIVKKQHEQFCSELSPPIVVNESKMKKFHKDFNVDKCNPIEEAELPEKPLIEAASSALQILEKSRALFEVNPKLSQSLAAVAEKKKEVVEIKPVTPAPVKTVRKDLQGLPQKLIDKILAKEAEQAAKEMSVDKVKEEKIRKLRRLPEIARIVRSIYVTEKKPALEIKIVSKKAVNSYPGNVSEENMLKDLTYLREVTKTWLTYHKIQGKEYLKINQSMDLNKVVADIEKMLAEEMK